MNNYNDRIMPNVECSNPSVEEDEKKEDKQICDDPPTANEIAPLKEEDIFIKPKKTKKQKFIPKMSETDNNTGIQEDLVEEKDNVKELSDKALELRKKRSERMKLLHAQGKLNNKKREKKVKLNVVEDTLNNTLNNNNNVLLERLKYLEDKLENNSKVTTTKPQQELHKNDDNMYKLTKQQMLQYTNKVKSKAISDYEEKQKIKKEEEKQKQERERKVKIQNESKKYFSRLPKMNMLDNSNPFDNCF